MTNVFDSWADDGREVDPGELPARLTALADNQPPDLPNAGSARQRRLDKMQRDLNDATEFVSDCDRWIEQTQDIALVGSSLRPLMLAHANKLRRRALDRARTLHGELQYLRSQTP